MTSWHFTRAHNSRGIFHRLSVELYVKVRRAVMVEGKSERAVACFFGIHRETVKKMCAYAAPPGYRRPHSPVSPTLAPFVPILDAILEADKRENDGRRANTIGFPRL